MKEKWLICKLLKLNHQKLRWFIEKIKKKTPKKTKTQEKSVEFNKKKHLRPLSSSPCNCNSSNGIICCLLYFFLLITMLPYTRISLNKKNCRAFARLRHIFVRTPSPTKTRPTTFNGCKYRPATKIFRLIFCSFKWRNEEMNKTYMSWAAKAVLHHIYPPGICLAIHWNG